MNKRQRSILLGRKPKYRPQVKQLELRYGISVIRPLFVNMRLIQELEVLMATICANVCIPKVVLEDRADK